MLLISMLLVMDTLVMIITLMSFTCIPAGTRGKPLPWVGMSLSPVSVGTVMSDMAWQGDMSGDPVGWIIFVILIMQGILEPPESTVDRVLF